LKREVALKVLPAAFSSNPERLARFQREAELLASLDHPNIGHIYGMVQSEQNWALVLALIEGPTLDDRIKQGPLPVDEAIAISKQIIDALEYAHEHGVIHRDLKPANIKVTPDGVVKVLDFGLAKALDQGAATSLDPENSPTLTMGATQAGVIMGTAAYMSPEQAVGKAADRRSDIFSFGVVLYEMLTGKRPFRGESMGDTLAAVVKDVPDWSALPEGTPRYLQRLLERMLLKDRRQRLQAIGEARIALESGAESPLQAESLPHNSMLPWIAAGVATLALLGLSAWTFYPRPVEPARVVKTTAMLPEGVTLVPNSPPTVSPDGRRIVFAANKGGTRALWVRDLDALEARMLPGTEGALRPFWAPDSRWVAFWASPKLKKIDVTGGPALSITDVTANGMGTWGADNAIVFIPTLTSGILRVPAAGGTPTKIVEGKALHAPWFLPDGRHFLYTGVTKEDTESAIYIGDVQASEADNAKNRKALVRTQSNAAYADPGYLLFVRERTLMAQPFDAAKLATTGDAMPVAEQVDYGNLPAPAQFSMSRNGVLVYTSGGAGANSQITWFDRLGKNLGTVGAPGDVQWPTLSPDGNTIAFDRRNGGNSDIWLLDLARGAESRFTFGPKGHNEYPVWSPDGTHIAFSSTRSTAQDIYQRQMGGTAMDEILDPDELSKRPTDWSRDGKFILEENANLGPTLSDLWMLATSPDRKDGNKPVAVLHSEFQEGQGKLSPDGHWLAYRSNESGGNEVYVTSFPTPTAKSKISTGGGQWPVWSRDGRELYFVATDRKLMAVAVKAAGEKFEAGVPSPLFEIRLPANGRYDVSKDGRFLVPMQIEQSAIVPLTIVQNWQSGLK